MKKLLLSLLAVILITPVLTALALFITVQTNQVSRSDLAFLRDLAARDGIGAAVAVVRDHIFGPDLSHASDPSFGRELVPGRGNAPWVIRSNLDGNPRMLNFALAPELWASYCVETQSLYQVWSGDILFEGAAYNYQHGPQPVSTGRWYWRDNEPGRWFVESNGVEYPAELRYLGHEYGEDRSSAGMRFELTANGASIEITEWPDVIQRDNGSVFVRRFELQDEPPFQPVFYTSDGNRHVAAGTVEIPLGDSTLIPEPQDLLASRAAEGDELQRGEQVIAEGPCLSCHAEHHKVAGPAWSQISGKFRGKIQEDVVTSLATSVMKGHVGNWGQVPMPPHPQLSQADARAAVVYILSIGEPEESGDPPLADDGTPYESTWEFDVLHRLTEVHPSFELAQLAPEGFEPKVGGMAFRSDGKLVMASWDLDGAVYLLDVSGSGTADVKRIAEGLHEPLGLTLVDDRIFVLQKQELTELIDDDGDEIIDRYRAVSYDWRANPNFHSFAFGLEHRDDAFYFLLSLCVLPGGASCPEQMPTQGKLLRAGHDGEVAIYASGFRTPNGLYQDDDGTLWVTDNQGDWLPASKLVRIEEGRFYGSRAVAADTGVMALRETAPQVWLPQDEVGNSPTQPLRLTEGPYAGQMIHGDVYNGGIKRVFLENVAGREQGAVFHFTAGLQGAVNRLARGPDGAIYIGETGNPPNWGEYGKPWFGFEKLSWQSNRAFEILAMRATAEGFELEFTQPLAQGSERDLADLVIKQWFYHPTEQYGGPKYDEELLRASAARLSSDRSRLLLSIPGLKAQRVVYLRLPQQLRSADGLPLWTAEAWYTLNRLPDKSTMLSATEQGAAGDTMPLKPQAEDTEDTWRPLFDGQSMDGWRNYGGSADDVRKWRVENGTLALQQAGWFPLWDLIKSVLFGGGSGDLIYYREKFRDFELSLEWKISENGNSGIFYLVADEQENTPWLTGAEMQVLHNEGHPDGKIETHRAGDLYDLIAADPETVLPPGQWNEARIRIQNNHIEHWLNGAKVVEVERGSEHWNTLVANSKFADMPRFGKAAEGYIVLQDHGDPVWYRNIKVRELSPDIR